MHTRKPIEMIKGRATSDGDGVKLTRVFGGHKPRRFDPFLLLDEFGSEEASDYIGGFPPHPHRGFETITYMLQGKMEHKDHMNNVGLLSDGGVQWMTAGKGIIHSEMPQQTAGKMRGFQLWLNLPAEKKLQAARYKDVAPAAIPVFQMENATVKAIAGGTEINGVAIDGHFDVPDTEVLYLDVHLKAGSSIDIALEDKLNSLIYSYDNAIKIGEADTPVEAQTLVRLSEEGNVIAKNDGQEEARFLLLAGKPLNQPIAQYGPFVMNTPEEIDQAIKDYRDGVLTD